MQIVFTFILCIRHRKQGFCSRAILRLSVESCRDPSTQPPKHWTPLDCGSHFFRFIAGVMIDRSLRTRRFGTGRCTLTLRVVGDIFGEGLVDVGVSDLEGLRAGTKAAL